MGIGLPEMRANFISGLIILFERRIRIGDTAGVVARTQHPRRKECRSSSAQPLSAIPAN